MFLNKIEVVVALSISKLPVPLKSKSEVDNVNVPTAPIWKSPSPVMVTADNVRVPVLSKFMEEAAVMEKPPAVKFPVAPVLCVRVLQERASARVKEYVLLVN